MSQQNLENRIDTVKLGKASELLRLVGHPQRLAILDVFSSHTRLCNSDIQEILGIEQAILSQHLTLMRDKGLLGCEREGKFTFWHLKQREFLKIVQCVENCCETL